MTDSSISSLSPQPQRASRPSAACVSAGCQSCAAVQQDNAKGNSLGLASGRRPRAWRAWGSRWGAKRGASERRYQATPGDVQPLTLLAEPHPAILRDDKDLYGMQEVRGSNPLSSTFQQLKDIFRY